MGIFAAVRSSTDKARRQVESGSALPALAISGGLLAVQLGTSALLRRHDEVLEQLDRWRDEAGEMARQLVPEQPEFPAAAVDGGDLGDGPALEEIRDDG